MNILLKRKDNTIKKIKFMKFNNYLKFHNADFYNFFNLIETKKQNYRSYCFLNLLKNNNSIEYLIKNNSIINICNI